MTSKLNTNYTAKGSIHRNADFPEAAERHLVDAKHLLAAGRTDNASYHSGYAIECLLKAALLATTNKIIHKHLHDLISLISGDAALYIDLVQLNALPHCVSANRWEPDMRYEPNGVPQVQAEAWVNNADKFHSHTVLKMTANGII